MLLTRVLYLFVIFQVSKALLNNSLQMMELVAEQARWRGWDHVLLISGSQGIHKKSELIKLISKQWFIAVWINGDPALEHIIVSKTGVVSFWPDGPLPPLHKHSKLILTEEQHLTSLHQNLVNISTIDDDLVLGYSVSSSANPEPENGKVHARQDLQSVILLKQVYKTGNSSDLTIKELGTWSENATIKEFLVPPETRHGNAGTVVKIGLKNTTLEPTEEHALTRMVENDEQAQLNSLLRCLLSAFNASHELISYPRLGFKTDEGGWTYLLGAVAEGTVDLASDTVDLSTDGIRVSMRITNPIVKTLSCVYFRRPRGGRFRDVVRATFSPLLQICVLTMIILLWVGMLAVTQTGNNNPQKTQREDKKIWEPTEALLWTISVVCMQGSQWNPKSLSGCILLIFTLLFSLITYNSFAAFITSFLSVYDNPIHNVKDLLESDYQFGYPQSTPEETFLRTVNDPNLRGLYYRGLVAGGGVEEVSDGINRTYDGTYAFFASARMARRALMLMVPRRYLCRITELPVQETKTMSSIPISKKSQFYPLINYWLLRLLECGILRRFERQLLPPMPSCTYHQGFNGASVADLISAYFLFSLGIILSWIILIIEILWAKKFKITSIFHKNHTRKSRLVLHDMEFSKPGMIWSVPEFIH